MERRADGFCSTCGGKPQEEAECAAEKCGHPTRLKGMAFCAQCAIKFGACRGCGVIIASPLPRGDTQD